MADQKSILFLLIEAHKLGFLSKRQKSIVFKDTLNSAIDILKILDNEPVLSAEQVAQRLKWHKNTAIIYLRALYSLGYLQDEGMDDRGNKLWQLKK